RRPALRQTLEECDRMLALDARLPALLEGDARPADAGERLAQARLYRDYGRPFAAARLYAAAFAGRPELASDLRARNRSHAARAAGAGGDPERPGGPERAALRRQALDWFRADLEARARQRRGNKSAAEVLKSWQTDAALSGVRDQASLE